MTRLRMLIYVVDGHLSVGSAAGLNAGFSGMVPHITVAAARWVPKCHEPAGRPKDRVIGCRPLLRCCEPGLFFALLLGFDLSGLFLDQFDEVVDDVGVFEAVVGEAADVDLVGAVAAAGEADVGFARFARAVDDAADHRKGQGRRDVREALFEPLDDLDDLELLARAGWAGDDGDAAPPQAERLQHLEADLDLLDRVGRQRDADRVADPGP